MIVSSPVWSGHPFNFHLNKVGNPLVVNRFVLEMYEYIDGRNLYCSPHVSDNVQNENDVTTGY